MSMAKTQTGGFRRFARSMSGIMTSRAVCLGWLTIACVLTAIGDPILGGMVFLIGIFALLVLTDDVLTTTLPFLLFCIFVSEERYSFIPC